MAPPSMTHGAFRFVKPRVMAVALLLSTSTAAVAQRDTSARARLVREMAEELRVTAHLPALSVAISEHGRIVFAEAFGYADIEQKRPATPDTRFRTGSVAKVITATALGRLVQERRLKLDVAVQEYVPTFPTKPWPITPRQLAGHLAGIPHYSDADKIERRFYPSVLDALGVFAAESLRSEPGTEYHYSTHGFTLLAAVIESASELPFLEYLQHGVLGPLGMQNTAPDLRAHPHPALAAYYRWQDGQLSRVEDPEDPSYKWAGGGMTTTPSDLLRLARGYRDGFLAPETVSMMWKSQRLSSGEETGVGIAWRNGRDLLGHRVMEHAGSMEGARSVICIFPDQDLAIAVMTNREWSSAIEETAHILASPYLSAASVQPPSLAPRTVLVETTAASGTKDTLSATLTLDGRHGTLRLSSRGGADSSYALFHLGQRGSYALVRPDGIYSLTIRDENGTLSGRALAYGSPLLRDPSTHPPFLSFTSEHR